MKDKYTVPNSTVSKKITDRSPLPQTTVKGSTFSKTTSMSGGTILKSGDVGKISVPPCSPSPPAKK